jgi:hypothetical protein
LRRRNQIRRRHAGLNYSMETLSISQGGCGNTHPQAENSLNHLSQQKRNYCIHMVRISIGLILSQRRDVSMNAAQKQFRIIMITAAPLQMTATPKSETVSVLAEGCFAKMCGFAQRRPRNSPISMSVWCHLSPDYIL